MKEIIIKNDDYETIAKAAIKNGMGKTVIVSKDPFKMLDTVKDIMSRERGTAYLSYIHAIRLMHKNQTIYSVYYEYPYNIVLINDSVDYLYLHGIDDVDRELLDNLIQRAIECDITVSYENENPLKI
jgi:hypothetical protein